jgi:hypothetical protein
MAAVSVGLSELFYRVTSGFGDFGLRKIPRGKQKSGLSVLRD